MVGKVYQQPKINQTPPKDRATRVTGKKHQASAGSMALVSKQVDSPKPVIASRVQAHRHATGPFKPARAPAPVLESKPAAKTSPKQSFADGESVPRLVQKKIFKWALEFSKQAQTGPNYRTMDEVLGLVNTVARKAVHQRVEMHHAPDSDSLARLIRLQEKGLIHYSEKTLLRADISLPALGLRKLPAWVRHLDLEHASYRRTAQGQQPRYFWEMLSDLKKRAVSLETLVLPPCVAYTNAQQEFLDLGHAFEQLEGHGFDRLKKLVVPGKVGPTGLPDALLKCVPGLETLAILHFDDDCDLRAVGARQNIKTLELRFRGAYFVSPESLFEKVGVMDSVEAFKCNNMDRVYTLAVLERHFPRLQSLIFGEEQANYQDIPSGMHLGNNAHLSTVTWHGADIPSSTFDALETLPKLDTLRAPNFPRFPAMGNEIADWAAHRIFDKIKVLRLDWTRLNAATLSALRTRFPGCKFEGVPAGLLGRAKQTTG